MKNNKSVAVVVGILILYAYAVLANMFTQSKMAVLFFEASSGIAVIGIAYLMSPFLKSSGKKMTSWYFWLKTIEGGLMILAGFLFLSANALLFGARDPIYVAHAYVFVVSAYLFYHLLYKSKLIPRFICLWGFVSVAALFVANLLELFSENNLIQILYLPIITNEVFLAIWLIVKGFNSAASTSKSVEDEA